jgi:ribosomal-protein-alanine N-acetyltransferase
VPQRIRLEAPSSRRQTEFLSAARRSRGLHRPWVKAPATAGEFAAYLKRRRSAANPGYFVVDFVSGQLVGVVNLNELVRGAFQSAYLGFYAFSPFEGQGFMSAGLSHTVTDAFRRRKLHRLEANIQPGNTRSVALVKRLGFRLEGLSPRYLKVGGRWRDHERWAVLAEEWRGSAGAA